MIVLLEYIKISSLIKSLEILLCFFICDYCEIIRIWDSHFGIRLVN